MFHDFSRKKISMLLFVASLLFGSVFVTTVTINYLGRDFLSNSILEARMALDAFGYKVSFAQASDHNLPDAILSSIENKDLSLPMNQNKAQSIPVLLYHGALENPDGYNTLLENLKGQLFALKKAGWQTVSIEDFYKFIKGEKDLPDKSFLLTFDDGRKDSYYPIDPILKALDYRATIFVITKYSLNNGHNKFYLWEDELRTMVESGRWDVQAHTHDGHDWYKVAEDGTQGHYYSNKLWLQDQGRLETEEEFTQRITQDFLTTKERIEGTLGNKVISFAYPFGDFGQTTVNFPESEEIVKKAINPIYPMSFYQVWPRKGFTFNYPNENQSLVKRIEVKSYWSPENLLKVLDTRIEKNLPYVDNFNSYNGWMKTYGTLSIKNNTMILGSRFSKGSSVFLDGSYLWKDYIFKSNIELTKGQTFSLLVRYKDDDNYVSCEFASESVKIQHVIGGNVTLIQEEKGSFINLQTNYEAGIAVLGNTVSCYLDGRIVLSGSSLLQMQDHGGVGFGTWNSEMDNSEITIKEVSVQEIK